MAKEVDPVVDLISVFQQSTMKFSYMHCLGKDIYCKINAKSWITVVIEIIQKQMSI